MIDEERLGQRFSELVQIDSESGSEALIAKVLEKELIDLGQRLRLMTPEPRSTVTAAILWPRLKAMRMLNR